MTAPTEHHPRLDLGAVPQQAGPPARAPVTAGAVRAPASPAADRAARRAFRPRRTIPATIAAIVLTLLGAYVAAEVISALVGRPLRLLPYDRVLLWGATTPWQSPQVLIGSALVALLGLVLLLCGLLPGKPRLLPVHTGDERLIVGLRPKSVTTSLTRAAEAVPHVRSARARLRRREVTVAAEITGRDKEGVAEAVRQAVTTKLASLALVDPLRVTVHSTTVHHAERPEREER